MNNLEILNKRFSRRRNRKKWMMRSAVMSAVGLVILAVVFVLIAKTNAQDIRRVPEGLPGEEADKWKNKAVDPEQFFINLNTTLTLKQGQKEANLNLANPPYSAYDITVSIVLNDAKETLLYDSETLTPGTYFETVELEQELTAGNYEAVVYYTFYKDSEGAVIGNHEVPITINIRK